MRSWGALLINVVGKPQRDLGENHDQRKGQNHHEYEGCDGTIDVANANLRRSHCAHQKEVVTEGWCHVGDLTGNRVENTIPD